ncbi:hypothetical protein OEA41_010275 [Lepraria neglecta]|uniref:Uncharacterized protein n=1 Tax=Lepraria neglecta TaxID=209136 RepID=A0AAD9YW97_9LECA|nr:hypothetical protein OEA41_010275 [Lepraria neglecta]
MPTQLPWEDDHHRSNPFYWSLPSEKPPTQPSRTSLQRRRLPQESFGMPRSSDERPTRTDRAAHDYMPREPSPLSQASRASSLSSSEEEDLDRILKESRNQVERLWWEADARFDADLWTTLITPGRPGRLTELINASLASAASLPSSQTSFEAGEEEEESGEGERTYRLPAEGLLRAVPAKQADTTPSNSATTNPFTTPLRTLTDIPEEPTPVQTSPPTYTAANSRAERLQRVREQVREVLHWDRSRRAFTLAPAEMHARFTDIRFGQRLDNNREAIRTLPLTLPFPPPSLEEITLNSAGEVSLGDSRDRHVRTTSSTPGEMSIDDPRDEEALGEWKRTRIGKWGRWCGAAWWKWVLVSFVGWWLMFAIGAALGMKKGMGACKPN